MKVGDTRTVPCSWCGEMVTEVLRRYPPSSGVTGLYWDCSTCLCGSLAGILALSRDRKFRCMGDITRGAYGPRGVTYRKNREVSA